MEPRRDVPRSGPLPARLPKGFVVGGHVVDGWVRDGGMAAIYRARRLSDDRRVALKLQSSSADDPIMGARFDREVAVMRRANGSRYVVDLLDDGVLDDGRRYLVMEWVEGENLEERLDFLRNDDQRLPIARACRIGRDVARGLAELHAQGVVHLDVKPANIMVRTGPSGRDEVTLVDFGIAADLRDPASDGEGSPGAAVLGTSAYMAPERVEGCAADPASDVYALGVVLFESISGSSVPPHGWVPTALPRLETLRRGVPTPLADLVRACMDPDPQRRPASAAQVAAALVGVIRALVAEDRRGEQPPVRTGATKVAPRSRVPCPDEAAEVPVKTGATEVTLTHDDVLVKLGEATEAEAMAAAHDEPAEPDEIDEADEADDSRGAASRPRRPWRWAALGGIAAALVAGAWVDGRHEADDRSGEGSVASTAAPRDAVIDGRSASTHARASDGTAVHERPTTLASADDLSSARPPRGTTLAPTAASARSGPDPCRRKRTQASHAKGQRQWREVLRITAAPSCWTSAAQRLQRKRLRVEAFAELREYGRCANEGAGSHDDQIAKRAKYCRTKRGEG